MSHRRPVVVVGGGTAGSVLVAQLAASTDRDIVVIEPGPISSFDDESRFLDLARSSDMLETIDVRHVVDGPLSGYTLARALGGGSAVNGLLLTGDEPEYVRGLTSMPAGDDFGRMSRALLATGGRPCRLWWNGGRWNPGRALAHLVDEGRVRWVNLPALSLSVGRDHPAVHVATGEIEAECVVMAAGAIRTPEFLLRSGLGAVNPRIGMGLQNHPTITIAMEFETHERAPFDATVVQEVITASGGQGLIVAYERASWTEPDLGLLSVSLMNPTSEGRVSVVGGDLVVDFAMLSAGADVIAMREAVGMLFDVASRAEFTSISQAIHADVHGASLDELTSMDATDLDRWIARSLQPVSHASASCRRAVDADGRLRGVPRVWLADASVLEGVPSCTPAAPVTMGALRVARAMGKELR